MFADRSRDCCPVEWQERVLKAEMASRPKPAVYFVGWEGGPIKIGWASNIRHRLHQMQVHCPYDLAVLATREGGADLESFYHRAFAPWLIRGEWFARNYLLLREIDKLTGMVRGNPMRFPLRQRAALSTVREVSVVRP